MAKSKWYAIECTDCETAIGFSFMLADSDPDLVKPFYPVYCTHCAHSHAEVANWTMPVGSDYGTNGLYEVQTKNYGVQKSIDFRRIWNKLFNRLEQHRIAKAGKN